MKLQDIINENIEDQHSEVYGEILDMLRHAENSLPAEEFAKYRLKFNNANKTFDRGYQTDNENLLYGSLDDLEELRDQLKAQLDVV